MSHLSSSRYRSQRASASTSTSSSSSSSSGRPPSSLNTRRFLDSVARTNSPPYESPYSPIVPNQYLTVPVVRQPSTRSGASSSRGPPTTTGSMSAYPSASDQDSIYSSPGRQDYQVVTASMTSNPQNLSKADKDRLIHSLRTHNINTLPELRRIERIFSALNAPDTAAPMQNAWIYYVDSHNLLNELRGLTRDYPFSSECLDEAKARVPRNGNGGGNYCWKVLKWVKDQSLIPRHARLLAAKPAMWGGKKPSAADVQKLATMCTNEWTRALTTLLRHWDANGA